MALIYIRHAAKELNGCDTNIIPGQETTIYNLAYKLEDNYGVPAYILSSPYKRCRETALILSSCYMPPIPICVDRDLSERPACNSLTPDTLAFNPILSETTKEYQDRITRILQHKEVVWLVTHSNVVRNVQLRIEGNTPDLIPFLYTYVYIP